VLRQRCHDRGRDKLYAQHAPEVECIGKGKARTRYERGVKVSIATTNALAPGGQFVLDARSLPGKPSGGHTLAAQVAQAERLTGTRIERGVTPTIRREPRRRSAIEPVIGHAKSDGHLGRTVLRDAGGDAIALVLVAAGHILRLLRAWLTGLLAFLLSLPVAARSTPRTCHNRTAAARTSRTAHSSSTTSERPATIPGRLGGEWRCCKAARPGRHPRRAPPAFVAFPAVAAMSRAVAAGLRDRDRGV